MDLVIVGEDVTMSVHDGVFGGVLSDGSECSCLCVVSGLSYAFSVCFCFVLIILYSLYLEYDSPLVPSASGLAG
jgi:hypothetical protein